MVRVRLHPALLALLVATVPAGAQEFHLDADRPRSVRFVSETTLEAFDGTTERIDGYVWLGEGMGAEALTPGATLRDGRIYFEVDLAAIETGIGLRDRHMREDYLETDDFPYATFDGRIGAVTAVAEGGVRITAPGTFSVHGVERTRTIDCRVTEVAPGFRVRCGFPVTLADHDIDIPQLMFMKLAEEVRVELDFHLRPAGEAP